MAGQFVSGFSFPKIGEFSWVCLQSCLNVCPSLNLPEPKCYSRNVDIGGFLLFQPGIFVQLTKIAILFIDIISIFMTMIMIYNVKRKYIAVGRKEIVIFFYFYLVSLVIDMLLATNIIGTTSFIYPVSDDPLSL